MKAVLLFSGQGAQKVGMGADLAAASPAAAARFERARAVLDFDLEKAMFEGPMEELTRTSRCQPALFLHGLALLDMLLERAPGLEIAGCAGLSLGEFTAHAAAGTFDFETGLRLVWQRGLFMEEACEQTKGAMAAMIGGEEAAVRDLAAVCGVDVANLNAPGQIVLSGTAEGIAVAVERAKGSGIRRAIPLPVAGAYHSRLMAGAQERLAAVLGEAALADPRVPVMSNYLGRAASGVDEIRDALISQVTGSVRWVECMSALIAAGNTFFIELGPDATLAGLAAKIDKSVRVVSARNAEEVAALASEFV
jgi:[acyl-carrier-protein] S-malonyltransferase